MSLKITILGCGSSGGVPRIDGDWGACDPEEPKNRRSRCSILVERKNTKNAVTSVLVDTSPDMREQLIAAGTNMIDAVLFTHDHADQTHGIDDLRPFFFKAKRRIDTYMALETQKVLVRRFGYIFKTPPGSEYPPIANLKMIAKYVPVCIEGPGGVIEAIPFEQYHGKIECLGFRIGKFAYANDLVGLPHASYQYLEGLDLLIVDALRYKTHPTHFNVEQALALIEQVKPLRSVLTNMHIDLDYNKLRNELPENIEPAYDGMVLEAPQQ